MMGTACANQAACISHLIPPAARWAQIRLSSQSAGDCAAGTPPRRPRGGELCNVEHNTVSHPRVLIFCNLAPPGHFFDFERSPRVRYCVEIAKVKLNNIPRTPSGPPQIPTDYSFAEYLSCNGQGRGRFRFSLPHNLNFQHMPTG
jgi:hypothetical protein